MIMSRERKSYDVFLSFMSRDTRHNFTGNLYNALRQKRVKTFLLPENDEELYLSCDQVSPPVLEAIQGSKISIVVFSENYAFSPRCLNELENILDCMRMNNQLLLPIFYKVKRADVVFHKGRYREAMDTHDKRFGRGEGSVSESWKKALSELINVDGHIYKGTESEYEFIQRIVNLAVQSLPRFGIFLSFSGEDTRHSFTGVLYNALRRAGFKTFMDDEGLVGGNEISKTLLQAIEKSRISVVVFSENYGYSSWCLDELVKIIECMKNQNQLIYPIFYKVEKEDVSNQTKCYGHAMVAHEDKFGKGSEKVRKWRSALSEIAFLEGQQIKENEYEYEFIKKIVEKIIDLEKDL